MESGEERLPFVLQEGGAMVFEEGFIITDEVVESSSFLFDTPLLKPYVSKFTTGNNKNITMANVFKLCVLLDCSPNDLFNWEQWRNNILSAKKVDGDYMFTTEDIKEML
tara:strand:- start:5410 stop:5736 length:327 start_codon:yes stop_codon:yes gene_type:complete